MRRDGFSRKLHGRRKNPDNLDLLFASLEHHGRCDPPGHLPQYEAATDFGHMRKARKFLAIDAVVIIKGIDVNHDEEIGVARDEPAIGDGRNSRDSRTYVIGPKMSSSRAAPSRIRKAAKIPARIDYHEGG